MRAGRFDAIRARVEDRFDRGAGGAGSAGEHALARQRAGNMHGAAIRQRGGAVALGTHMADQKFSGRAGNLAPRCRARGNAQAASPPSCAV